MKKYQNQRALCTRQRYAVKSPFPIEGSICLWNYSKNSVELTFLKSKTKICELFCQSYVHLVQYLAVNIASSLEFTYVFFYLSHRRYIGLTHEIFIPAVQNYKWSYEFQISLFAYDSSAALIALLSSQIIVTRFVITQRSWDCDFLYLAYGIVNGFQQLHYKFTRPFNLAVVYLI